MSTIAASPIAAVAGGGFLLESRTPAEIFTPEDLNEEQRQIAATAARFAREEISPRVAAIERKEPGAMEALLQKRPPNSASPQLTSRKNMAAWGWIR